MENVTQSGLSKYVQSKVYSRVAIQKLNPPYLLFWQADFFISIFNPEMVVGSM